MRSSGIRLALAGAVLAASLAGQTTARLPATTAPAAAAKPAANPAETAAITSLVADYNDPATSPSTMGQAITQFQEQFPQSKEMLPVLVLGVRFARAHDDYFRLLDYGDQVLQHDPHNLYTISSLGMAIPDNVKQTDLDLQPMLDKAQSYDQQVINAMNGLMVTGPTVKFEGNTFTAAQVAILKDNLEGPAYISLGRVAMMEQKYASAVAAFTSALSFEKAPPSQAQVYFNLGQAQAALGHVPEAQAAFDKTLALAPNSPFLKRMVQIEQAKLKSGGNS